MWLGCQPSHPPHVAQSCTNQGLVQSSWASRGLQTFMESESHSAGILVRSPQKQTLSQGFKGQWSVRGGTPGPLEWVGGGGEGKAVDTGCVNKNVSPRGCLQHRQLGPGQTGQDVCQRCPPGPSVPTCRQCGRLPPTSSSRTEAMPCVYEFHMNTSSGDRESPRPAGAKLGVSLYPGKEGVRGTGTDRMTSIAACFILFPCSEDLLGFSERSSHRR